MASITDYLEQYEKNKKAGLGQPAGKLDLAVPITPAQNVGSEMLPQIPMLPQGQAGVAPEGQVATPPQAEELGFVGGIMQGFRNQNEKMAQSSYSPFGGISTPSTAVKNVSGLGGAVEEVGSNVMNNFSDEAIMNRMAVSQGKPTEPAVGTPAFGLADPSSSTATGEDPFSAPIVQPATPAVADPSQPIQLKDPTSSTAPLNETQAMLQERFGAPTISAIQSAEEGLGMRTDAQGRMVDPEVDRSFFNQQSADREARQAARPDFGEAISDRDRRAASGDGMSDADRRDIAKANAQGASASDIARGDKVAGLAGIDRRTGKPLDTGNTGLNFDDQMKLRRQQLSEDIFGYELTKDSKKAYDTNIADVKKAKTAEARAASVGKGLASSVSDMRNVMGRAAGRLDGFFATDMAGKAASFWKGSDADAQEADFAFLKSNVALNAMMELKANSPTGSTGFGALNTEELKVLTNQFATLDPFTDSKLVRQNLKQLNERFEGIIQNAYDTHAAEYGDEAAESVYGSMMGGNEAQSKSNQAPSGKSVTTANGRFTATAVID